MKRAIALLILIIFALAAGAQSLQQRIFLEKNMVLLKNKQSLLPLLHLDTLRISIKADSSIFFPFYNAFWRYAPTVKDEVNLTVYPVAPGHIPSIFNHPNIIIIFDTTLNLIDTLSPLADVLLLMPGHDSLAQDYAVQLLFGAIAAQGTLPDSTQLYPQNSGLRTASGLRLKYTVPAELGLDSVFIFSQIDSIVNNAIRQHAFPGCQILAARDGKVFFYRSYGYLTYDSLLPVTMNHIYDLASITKIAASAPCLMLLYDKELLDLHQPLAHYLPWLRWSNKRKILLIDALTHQARLWSWIPFWTHTLNRRGKLKKKYFSSDSSNKYPYPVACNLYASKKTIRLVHRLIKKSKLLPVKQYRYSDLSFYLYPELVERLTGEDFRTCLKKNFYKPLGAWRMDFRPYEFYPQHLIVPTEQDSVFRGQLVWGYVHDEGAAMIGGISGHAGLFANVDDLAKLMQMYLNYGYYGNRRYLSDTTLRRWTSYQFASTGNRRGLVFDKPMLTHPERGTPSPLASPQSFGHSGFTGTFAWADPQTGLIFIFLSNRVYPTRKNRNLLRLNVRTNIHNVLYQAILNAEQDETNN